MGEKIKLVFKDGTQFEWDTGSIRQCVKVSSLQMKHGDPTEIIGEGKVAVMLREKYRVYNQNPEAYKPKVMDTASQLSGIGKKEIEKKFEKFSKKLGFKHE